MTTTSSTLAAKEMLTNCCERISSCMLPDDRFLDDGGLALALHFVLRIRSRRHAEALLRETCFNFLSYRLLGIFSAVPGLCRCEYREIWRLSESQRTVVNSC
jgi:hypothetical protein